MGVIQIWEVQDVFWCHPLPTLEYRSVGVGCVNQTLHFLVSLRLFAEFGVVKAHMPMLGNV